MEILRSVRSSDSRLRGRLPIAVASLTLIAGCSGSRPELVEVSGTSMEDDVSTLTVNTLPGDPTVKDCDLNGSTVKCQDAGGVEIVESLNGEVTSREALMGLVYTESGTAELHAFQDEELINTIHLSCSGSEVVRDEREIAEFRNRFLDTLGVIDIDGDVISTFCEDGRITYGDFNGESGAI